jgi:putative endonuclease
LQYYVYIMSNYDRKVIYVGITSNLLKRVNQHKSNHTEGFTKKYNLHYLVYYEVFNDPVSAIEREKQIKGWNRPKKNKLIIDFNPKLVDIYPELLN